MFHSVVQMQIFATKTTPCIHFPLSQHNKTHFPNYFHSQNGIRFNKPSSKPTLLSPKTHPSNTTVGAHVLESQKEAKNRNFINTNAKISQLCEMGNLQKAVELLCMSKNTQIEQTIYCSLLQLCAELKSLSDGKTVHSFIRSSGVGIDGVLGSKLVFMYVSCGELREGRLVFDEVASDKTFIWNFLMNGYAKIGDFNESVFLFYRMLCLGIGLDSHTFTCVLKCFAALGGVREGECVHAYLLKSGFGSYNAVSVVNSLISFYFKIGRVESATKLFDDLSERDVVSWNSMISGCVANGLNEQGLLVFETMLISGIGVDLATMVSVLAACASCGNVSLGESVHALALKSCFDGEIIFGNMLVDMYSKCGNLGSAVRVFEKMSERSVVSWTSLIGSYARVGRSGEAIQLFYEMEREGVKPDIFLVTTVLHACACNESLEVGQDVHDYIRRYEMQPNLSVCNALIDMYAKCGNMDKANLVFLEMPVKDIISWNTMIGGYSKNSLPNEAISTFAAMVQEVRPDGRTMACILPACASLAALDRGREIHSYILKQMYFSDRHIANALVDMYVKCGALVLAQLLFNMMPTKDLISWTVMIAGYGMHGLGKEAIEAFKGMRQEGIEPDEVSFVSILYACSHSGLLDEGWKFFNIMQKECNIKPKLEHYACVVDLLARTGKLKMAYSFIKSMPIKPDATIWGALLRGCRTYVDVELAEKVAECVFELEPDNTGYYVLLANIYAEAEKWEKVKKLREKIGRRGLKKNPGCSWMEARGRVHIFLAGDGSHPEHKQIASFLKMLRSKMKEEGYSLKTQYALINADEREKEVSLCGHSEKIAMAFGILRLPPGKAIRVTKNLRVCGDCHETAKFMSKTFRREIVLRDSNRFHYFRDGVCSCRGFW